MDKKKSVERFEKYALQLSEFLKQGFTVLAGDPEAMLKQLTKYIKHAENMWNDAVSMYETDRFSTSCFLSIVCIEECSKISFGEFQYFDRLLKKEQTTESKPSGRNPLNQHTKKHFIAACSGALVNARMDRTLGTEKVAEFIDKCESGEIEIIRQISLYADIDKGGKVLLPEDRITKEQSLFYVCLAGELLSQVEGAAFLGSTFEEKLNRFENKHIEKKQQD